MRIKSIKQLKSLWGKKILLRTDFNIPHEIKGRTFKIQDDYKIVMSLPTIRYLLRYRCKIIIISHLEPSKNQIGTTKTKIGKEKDKKDLSLKPVSLKLSRLLGKKVKFIPDCLGEGVKDEVAGMKEGEILLLENLRFYAEEKNNDKVFAAKLASIVEGGKGIRHSLAKRIFGKESGLYINDAFAVSHREHASLSAIKEYLPCYSGLLVEKEIKHLQRIINPEHPAIAVLGGAKISTKINLIKKLEKKFDYILMGGGLANNFLQARGYEIGNSIVSPEDIALAKKFKSKKIIIPADVLVLDEKGNSCLKKIKEVKKKDVILDIGPETIKLYASYIKSAKTLIWSGPLGKFEDPRFKQGSLIIARTVASRSGGRAFGIAGGGETFSVLKMTGMENDVDWVSTGGGAMLAFLGGEEMPGLRGIFDF